MPPAESAQDTQPHSVCGALGFHAICLFLLQVQQCAWHTLELFESQQNFGFRNVLVQIQDPKGDDQDDALFFVDTGGVAT